MATTCSDVTIIDDISPSSNKGVPSQNRKNTVTAFRGVWQATVGTMHHSSSGDIIPIEKGPTKRELTHNESMTESNPSVFQIDLGKEEVSDRKSATAQIKVTAGGLWQTLSPWRRHNKVAPSPRPLQESNLKRDDDSLLLVEDYDDKENAQPVINRKLDLNDDTSMIIKNSYTTNTVESTIQGPSPSQESHPPSPEYSKIMKRNTKMGGDRYTEPHPSPMGGVNHDSIDVIRVLSQSPLSDEQDSLYESFKDDNEEHYSEISNHSNEVEGGVQLLSIKGRVRNLTNEEINLPKEGLINNNNNNNNNSTGMGPIHHAAAKGNKKELQGVLSLLPIIQDPVESVLGSDKFCVRKGVDERDGEGRTALMHAVHHDHLKCVKLLAKSGANINTKNTDGSTCLHEASFSGSVEMIAHLLSLGANGLHKDEEGRLPIHWCMSNHNSNCVKLLLEKVPGLDPNVSDGSHMTPLMWAGYYGRAENIELLKQNGGDVKLVDCEGMRAIHWSAKSHDLKTLQVLLNTDSARYQDNKGRTIMHHAAKEGFAKAIPIIKGTSPLCINDQDHNGRTSLHWAAACEKPEVIRALLASGADPNISDIHGYTALDYAVQKHLPYCSLLLAQGQQEATLLQPDHSHTSTAFSGRVLPMGEATAIGVRTLLQQEGKVLDEEVGQNKLSTEHIVQIKVCQSRLDKCRILASPVRAIMTEAVCTGAWINKFTTEGKGPLHPRFVWIDPATMTIHWGKTMEARYINSKETKKDTLVGVRLSASGAILKRKDFDPVTSHKYAFTIFTKNKVLDVVALSSDDFKMWLNGLQLLLHLGNEKAFKVINGKGSFRDF